MAEDDASPLVSPGGRRLVLFGAPVLAAAMILAGRAGLLGSLPAPAAAAAALGLWMAAWWVTEAAPLAATSLLPLVALPLLELGTARTAAAPYADPLVMLMLGGFFLSVAVERSGLHRRVALHVLRRIGARPRRLVAGFLVATAFISMWISNTATALMMLPIALAVVRRFEDRAPGDPRLRPLAVSLLLAVAYASSLGGLATPIGTAPNVIFLGQYRTAFPEAPPLGFLDWMTITGPLVVVLLGITWVVLTRFAPRLDPNFAVEGPGPLDEELRGLGRWRPGEKRMALAFAVTAALWILRQPIEVGDFTLGGYARWMGWDGKIDDGTVVMAVVLVLFVVPTGEPKPDNAQGTHLLAWKDAVRIPWEVVLLFGGGLALADAFERSGLSGWIGAALTGLGALPAPVMIGLVCLGAVALTEVASNIALTTILMPILAAVAREQALSPLALMLPGALAASCGFMMPVGTPPNAIVFATGHVTMRDMVTAGVILDLASVVVLTLGWGWRSP